MSEMVDKCSLELAKCWCAIDDEDALKKAARLYEASARAVIRAMREPTAAMIRAVGYRVADDKDIKDWMEGHDWPRMIDAALRE